MFLYPFFENIYIGTSKLYYLEKKRLKDIILAYFI